MVRQFAIATGLLMLILGCDNPVDGIDGSRLSPAEWSTIQFGSSTDDGATCLAITPSGAVVVGGWTEGDLFEGSGKAFLASYNGGGEYLWGRRLQFGNGGIESVAVDPSGDILALGGESLVKYSPTLLWRWTRAVAPGTQWLAVDGAGNVYVAGRTEEPFGSYQNAVYAARFGPSGEPRWSQRAYFDDTVLVRSIAVDEDGNTYLACETQGGVQESLRGYYSVMESGLVHGVWSQLLIKYDGSGDVQWIRDVGGWEAVSGEVAVDAGGDLYLSGVDDPHPEYEISPASLYYLLKVNRSGVPIWFRDHSEEISWGPRAVAANRPESRIATDRQGNVYWQFADRLRKYSRGGEQIWTQNAPRSRDLAVDRAGSLYLVGETSARLGETHFGRKDAFLMKYVPSGE